MGDDVNKTGRMKKKEHNESLKVEVVRETGRRMKRMKNLKITE